MSIHVRRTCAMNVYTMIHVRRTPVRRTCTAYMYHSVNTLLSGCSLQVCNLPSLSDVYTRVPVLRTGIAYMYAIHVRNTGTRV